MRTISSHSAAVIVSMGARFQMPWFTTRTSSGPRASSARRDQALGLAVPGEVGAEGDRRGPGRLDRGRHLRAAASSRA